MPAIYHEGSWLGNATDPEVLVKDTVGWTGKNKCETIPAFTLVKGSERTKNNTIKDTPNYGTYKVSFMISNAANITKQGGIQIGDSAGNWSASADGVFDVVNGRVLLTIPFAHAVSRVYVFINGHDGDTATATFSDFMITDVNTLDQSFEPYHESVEEYAFPASAQGVLGAKNLLPKFSSGTDHGITYTVDGDGVVTGNGTASDNNSTIGVKVSLKAGSYILSGCPSGGSTNTYRINAYLSTSPYTNYGNDTGEGLALSFTTDTTIMVQIVVKNGASISNLTFKPMLRLASDPDDTYQPYAMTNRELTEEKINIADLKTVVSASSDFADFKTRIASL